MIDSIVRNAAPVIARTFRPDCCLNATRVMIEVFRDFGVPARAVVVSVTAVNAAWVEQALALGRAPTVRELADGAWAIGIGEPEPPRGEGWPGHVVVFARGRLIDMAAGNIARPARRIYAPAFVCSVVPSRWEHGEVVHEVSLPAEGRMFYRALPRERSHERLPGFRRSLHNLDAAREIKARIAITA